MKADKESNTSLMNQPYESHLRTLRALLRKRALSLDLAPLREEDARGARAAFVRDGVVVA